MSEKRDALKKVNFWWECIYLHLYHGSPRCRNPNLYMSNRRRDCLMNDCDCMVFENMVLESLRGVLKKRLKGYYKND